MNVAVMANQLQESEKTKLGRPTGYSQEIATVICGRMISGESLRSICKDENMPSLSMVFRWLGKEPIFREQYAHARELQAEAMFEEMFDIADDSRNDKIETETGAIVDHENIQRSRLRVDTRKWALSKLVPKKYGDKLVTEHSGPGGGPIELANMTDHDRAKAIASVVARIKAV